ncbi:hypothetical protein OPV22_015798 [Ensete ventricosum]|uniref:Uncharacterized protein n=1 Tax=Ensete ventricosum TaxID=4639 RepID=A0AAV8R0X7_ENSVE|nr:hypothetical protein OPV22_015798 [Ensete ventricosum]
MRQKQIHQCLISLLILSLKLELLLMFLVMVVLSQERVSLSVLLVKLLLLLLQSDQLLTMLQCHLLGNLFLQLLGQGILRITVLRYRAPVESVAATVASVLKLVAYNKASYGVQMSSI